MQLDPDMWMIVWMFVGLLFVIGVIRSCNRRPWIFLCGIAVLFAMVPLFRYLSVRQPAAPVAQAEEIDAETDVDTAAIKARIKSLEEGERPLIPLDGTEIVYEARVRFDQDGDDKSIQGAVLRLGITYIVEVPDAN